MSEGRLQPDERDVLKMLTLLAGESRVYRMHLENAGPVLERLSAGVDDVAAGLLWTSVIAALGQPPHLGTPRHIEANAVRVFRELDRGGP